MNIVLWVFQVLLALHTGMGAVWKFSHSTDAVPSLEAIPQVAWVSLSVVELLCVAGLVLPIFNKQLGMLAPIAAAVVVAEMLLFTAVHIASGNGDSGQIVYWLVVAAACAFLAYGRFVLAPLAPATSAA
jgi:hypothetical protein